MAGQKTIFLKTTGSQQTWNVPDDFSSLVSIEAIASGVSGADGTVTASFLGGGGGAYAKTDSTAFTSLTAQQSVYYRIGTGSGGITYFSSVSGGPTASSNGVKAVSGIMATGSGSSSTGGAAASCIGTLTYSGGGSGRGYTSGWYQPGGGGGAAGPGGAGKNGGSGSSTSAYGSGGGGCNGGSSTAALTTFPSDGGKGPTGTAGGLGATDNRNSTAGSNGSGGGGGYFGSNGLIIKHGSNGSQYPVWTQTSNSEVAGPGSGGGGGGGWSTNGGSVTYSTIGGNAGGYGGGGGAAVNAVSGTLTTPYPAGAGTQGIIVFTYNSVDPTITINTQPSNQEVTEPTGATFSVSATASFGTLTYQWQKADAATPTSWSNISGATSSSYTKTPTSFANDDGDLFRCVITVSGYGVTSTSNSATLTVKAASTGNFFMVF